jgi:hypothetical protein
VSIGNAILVNGLSASIGKYAPGISAVEAIRVGPLNLPLLTSTAAQLHGLREAFAVAIQHVMIFALVTVCVSVPVACGMQWLNIVKLSREREQKKAEGEKGAAVA